MKVTMTAGPSSFFGTFLPFLFLISPVTRAYYVSYEQPTNYQQGQTISLVANKLTSPTALTSIDYSYLSFCGKQTNRKIPSTSWHKAISALHGDAWHTSGIDLTVGVDVYCATLCTMQVTDPYVNAIANDFHYNWDLDGLPAGLQYENDDMISKRYWGGIPLGRRGGLSEFEDARFANTTSSDLFIYNHYNIEVLYEKNKDSSYNIVRFIIAPYSMDQRSITSCLDGTKNTHTIYEEIHDAPIQRASGNVPFTYDVQWVEYDVSHKERWNVYLSMGDAVPNYVEFLGFFLGGLIFVILVGVLYTWVMRDLSYKPVVDEADVSDEEAAEVQMWPLSTRIFFPPRHAQIPLCVACGTGAQLCVSGFLFVFLFRCGIISQSQGAKLLTPGAILYAICSPIGGYVTARLYAIFHGDRTIALALSLMTAITFPLLGIFVVLFVYDIFPDDNAPEYMAMSSSVPLILVWIFFVWPLTVAGGYLGHRGGAIQNFPVSAGSAGYQDLALQDSMNREEEERRARGRIGKLGSFAKKYRAAILFLTIGILPVLSCFVSFSYGVAAPIFLGAYSVRSYLIASFGLFILNSGAAAALMYYRQIRVHHFDWWWTSFASGTSAGFYIFLLLVSWLLFRSDEDNLTARTKVMYLIWFLFIAIGAGLASGCIGVAACIWFNKALYTFIMRKQ